MKSILRCACSALTATIITTSPYASADDFDYSHITVGYYDGDANLPADIANVFGLDRSLDIDGFEIQAQYSANEIFHFFANYQDADISLIGVGSSSINAWAVGFGGHGSINDETDIYWNLAYRHSNFEIDGLLDESFGHIPITVGFRWAPFSWVEFKPAVTHYLPINDGTNLEAAESTVLDLRAYLTDHEISFQPYIGYLYTLADESGALIGDLNLLHIGCRVSF